MNSPLPVDQLHSLGIVCDRLDATLAELSRFFGIEEWQVRRLETGNGFSVERSGKPVAAKLLVAAGETRNIRFNVIAPIDGGTIFTDWLERRGPGAHDLATNLLSPEAFEKVLPELRRNGLNILQTMRLGEDLEVHYLDSVGQLGVILRILVPLRPGGERLDCVPVDTIMRFPTDPPESRLPIEAPYHVCINTAHRRDSVREAFQRILGVEQWFEYDNETGVSVEQAHYHGRPADARFRLTCGRRGDFSVEVVEMIFGDSVYEDMLREKGEGVHHLFTTVCTLAELESAKQGLEPDGYAIVQDGRVGDIYYGYLAARGRMADLAVEMLCPIAPNWTEDAGEDFWKILMGETYRTHRLVDGMGAS